MNDVINILSAACVVHTTAGNEWTTNLILINNLENALRNQSVTASNATKNLGLSMVQINYGLIYLYGKGTALLMIRHNSAYCLMRQR